MTLDYKSMRFIEDAKQAVRDRVSGLVEMLEPAPSDQAPDLPIHRRGRFKPNARRQKGHKTLPRTH